MSQLQELTEQYKPLRERVFDLIKDETTFTIKDIKRLFPSESDKALYRVMKELESQKRIRFLTWHERSKLYTAIGSSELPMLQSDDGSSFPVSDVLKNIEQFYGPDGYWTRLEGINKLPIVLSQLFIVAQIEEPKLYRDSWISTQQNLLKIRSELNTVLGYIDSVLKHPSMNGDLAKFKSVYAGEDEHIPSPKQITGFKVWLTKFWGAK